MDSASKAGACRYGSNNVVASAGVSDAAIIFEYTPIRNIAHVPNNHDALIA